MKKMMKLVFLIGLFLVIKTTAFAQDTAKLVSSKQMVRMGTSNLHQEYTYKLNLFRNDKQEKIMTVSDSSSTIVYRADEFLGSENFGDTTVVYYTGSTISPTQGPIAIALLIKDNIYIEIVLKLENGYIMFEIDKEPIKTTSL